VRTDRRDDVRLRVALAVVDPRDANIIYVSDSNNNAIYKLDFTHDQIHPIVGGGDASAHTGVEVDNSGDNSNPVGPGYHGSFAGVAVASLGYNHPKYVKMMQEQVAKIHVGSFATEVRANLSRYLAEHAVGDLRRTQYYSGGAEAVVTYGNVLAALALFPFVRGELAVGLPSALVLTFLGVVQIGGAYALFVAGLRHVTATQASLVGMLEPISNPIWVFLFLGERPGPFSILGGAIVLGAIAWRTVAGGSAAVTPPPLD
jgi:hypothetical protein